MRLLCSFVGGFGHYEPVRAIARVAAARGHDVVFACHAGMVDTVAADGFAVVAVDAAVPEPSSITPLMVPDRTHELRVLREGFARRTAFRRAKALVRLCNELQPDAIACDEVDFGAVLTAEHHRVPAAVVLVLVAGTFATPDVLAEPLADVRSRLGLAPTPTHEPFVVAPFPRSFRDPAYPLPPDALAIRPTALDGDVTRPTRDRPLVYATLGTIFNLECGDLMRRVLDGLGSMPVDVIATVGRQIDPATFDPLPANVRVERFVPQSEVLARCDAVVCHGGSGSVIGALSHGIPLVVLPMGADQPDNAARVRALGVGIELDPVRATRSDIADAVTTLLHDTSFGQSARRRRVEALALPPIATALDLIESLGSP